jgi:hypothetical protein
MGVVILVSLLFICYLQWPMNSPYSNYLFGALDISAVGTTFNVLGHDTMSGRDSNLSPPRQ